MRDTGSSNIIVIVVTVLVVVTVFLIGAYFLFGFYKKRMLEMEREKELLNEG